MSILFVVSFALKVIILITAVVVSSVYNKTGNYRTARWSPFGVGMGVLLPLWVLYLVTLVPPFPMLLDYFGQYWVVLYAGFVLNAAQMVFISITAFLTYRSKPA